MEMLFDIPEFVVLVDRLNEAVAEGVVLVAVLHAVEEPYAGAGVHPGSDWVQDESRLALNGVPGVGVSVLKSTRVGAASGVREQAIGVLAIGVAVA